jgi:hypothetical protein
MKFYSGVGSRQTPRPVLKLMKKIASLLADQGYVLRSGAAEGADQAFEMGCDSVSGKKEIYLPWRSFNGNISPFYRITQAALDMAADTHPAWDKCSQGAKKLHARNCYQIMGGDLKTPSEFVVCWTVGAKPTGGTATVLKIAVVNNIPIYNISLDKDLLTLGKKIGCDFDVNEGYSYIF